MSSVWASDDVRVWQGHLAQVGKRLQALDDPKLEELERCVLQLQLSTFHLPNLRESPYSTADIIKQYCCPLQLVL